MLYSLCEKRVYGQLNGLHGTSLISDVLSCTFVFQENQWVVCLLPMAVMP